MDRGVGLAISESGWGRIEYYRVHENTLASLLNDVGLTMDTPRVRGFGRGTTAVSDVAPVAEDRPSVSVELTEALTKAGFEVGPM